MKPTKPRPTPGINRCAHCGALMELSRQQMCFDDGRFRWACIDIAGCADRVARRKEEEERRKLGP